MIKLAGWQPNAFQMHHATIRKNERIILVQSQEMRTFNLGRTGAVRFCEGIGPVQKRAYECHCSQTLAHES